MPTKEQQLLPEIRGGSGQPPSPDVNAPDFDEDLIRAELRKYEGNWDAKADSEKDKFFPAWEATLRAQLGLEPDKNWCQKNNLDPILHGEIFRRLAAKRRQEKMTPAEIAQGLTSDFLIFREILPNLLKNKDLIDLYTAPQSQQGGQNAAKP